MPTFIVLKDQNGYHVQHKTKVGFRRLNPLGWKGNTEYNHDTINPTSINLIITKAWLTYCTENNVKVTDNL
jgi:hypothetical protein